MVRTRSWFYMILVWFAVWGSMLLPAHRSAFQHKNGKPKTKFTLRSSAFRDKKTIPVKYTCDGADISPPLQWSNAPRGTKSFVLICKDPDASGGKSWVHWVVANIPATKNKFYEKIKIGSFGGIEGNNSWDVAKYDGPCPPVKVHRYVFTLYALKVPKLRLRTGAKYDDVIRVMKNNILGSARLTGMYQRLSKKL